MLIKTANSEIDFELFKTRSERKSSNCCEECDLEMCLAMRGEEGGISLEDDLVEGQLLDHLQGDPIAVEQRRRLQTWEFVFESF